MTDRLTDADLNAMAERYRYGQPLARYLTAPKVVQSLVQEVRRLRAAEDRVREVHEWQCLECDGIVPEAIPMCADCYEPWPCPTIAALDGGER